MATLRRVVPESEFVASLLALDCQRAKWMATELAVLLLMNPDSVPAIEGSAFRVLHTNAYEKFPALRLIYRFDDEALYLLDVEIYDPLLADGIDA